MANLTGTKRSVRPDLARNSFVLFSLAAAILVLSNPSHLQADSSLQGPKKGTPFSMDLLPYKTKVYGETKDIFCDLEDPAENVACLAHDATITFQQDSMSQEDMQITFALESAQLIQKLGNSGRYSLYIHTLGLPTSSSKMCLKHYFAICGNHQELFAEVMRFLGIKTRHISMYYQTDSGQRHNHAASEFMVGGKWRFIDVTWSAIWLENDDLGSALGFQELRNKKSTYQLVNQLDSWYLKYKHANVDHFEYVTVPDRNILALTIGPTGSLRLPIRGREDFAHIPNYLGTAQNGTTMVLRTRTEKKFWGLYNFQAGNQQCNGKRVVLRSSEHRYTMKPGDNFIPLKGEQKFAVEHEPGTVCYIIMKNIQLVSTSPSPGRK